MFETSFNKIRIPYIHLSFSGEEKCKRIMINYNNVKFNKTSGDLT